MKTLLKVAKKSTPQEKAYAKAYRMKNKGKIRLKRKRRRRKIRQGSHIPRKRKGSPSTGYTYTPGTPQVSSGSSHVTTSMGGNHNFNPSKMPGTTLKRVVLKGK